MTNGTSQGLFVVVAIVIFGIFVGLSYTLFGDTLQPQLVNIFITATDINSTPVKEFMLDKIGAWKGSKVSLNPKENSFKFSNNSSDYRGGLSFPADYFKKGSTYRLSFDMTKLSGDIKGIGGHLFTSDKTVVSIDGQEITEGWRTNTANGMENETDWSLGVVYPNDTKTHHVTVTFEMNIDAKDSIMNDPNIYIQPNRNQTQHYITEALDYSVLIENIRLDELNKK